MNLLKRRYPSYLLLAIVAIAALLATGCAAAAGAQGGPGNDEDAVKSVGLTSGFPYQKDGSDVPYEGPSGISVSGSGLASGAPDIAVLSLGVESTEDTAAEARSAAAVAMQRVLEVLEDAGVDSADIQTRHFNISPRYQGVEVERCDEEEDEGGITEIAKDRTCYTVWESRLIGYSVSNQASVKIRSLDNVGSIIDKTAEAAGDLVRINGISFSIDDPQPLHDEARTNAVADMKRKAEMLAELSGVKLGSLVYINESGAFAPPQPYLARAEAAAFASSDAATSISGGELEFRISVQGVYLIAGEVDAEETDDDEDQQSSSQ